MKLKPIAIMIVVYIVIVVAGLYIYQYYAQLSGIYLKAAKYDHYKEYMDRIENCTTIPIIICSTSMLR